MPSREKASSSGFTLIEVLVALSLTVVVTFASYTGLSVAIEGTDQLRITTTRLSEVDRAFGMLTRDLRQVIDRPIRDEFGDVLPALVGGDYAEWNLSFTRAGWRNPVGISRSDLQRVNYYLRENNLYRESFFTLDRIDQELSRQDAILEGVSELRILFLESTRELTGNEKIEIDYTYWRENWVPLVDSSANHLPLPAAVEVTLVLDDIGELRRLYEMPIQ